MNYKWLLAWIELVILGCIGHSVMVSLAVCIGVFRYIASNAEKRTAEGRGSVSVTHPWPGVSSNILDG
jgi:hypothetical protein